MLVHTKELLCAHLISDLATCVIWFVASRNRRCKFIGQCGEYESCAQLTVPDDIGRCLKGACLRGHLHIAKMLLDKGDTRLGEATKTACCGGHTTIAQMLIVRGANFDYALNGACRGGHKHIAQWALDNGARNWHTALRGACRGGRSDMVEWLVAKGANDWEGALSAACRAGQRELAERAIAHGASNWNWGLNASCRGGHDALAHWMVTKGADNFGYALSGACRGAHAALARKMARGTVDWDYCLWRASQGGSLEIVQWALFNGATNLNGALGAACDYGHPHIQTLLIARGATTCANRTRCCRTHSFLQ